MQEVVRTIKDTKLLIQKENFFSEVCKTQNGNGSLYDHCNRSDYRISRPSII